MLLVTPAIATVIGLDVVARKEGGMGELFIVRERGNGIPKLAVLKSIAVSKLGSPQNAENFVKEAVLMTNLNIWPAVWLLNIKQEGMFTSRVFIKMEYCPGGSLADRMELPGMPYPEAIHHLLCVVVALAGLHRDGLVHADLKLANILIGKDTDISGGNPEWVTLLADFGLTSKYRGASTSGRVGGTPQYSSPEQLLGEAPCAPMDIWSWGVMAYQLLTGQHPYSHLLGSMQSLTGAMRETGEIDIDFSNPGLSHSPEWLSAMVRASLKKDPGERPTIRAVLDAFRNGIKVCQKHGEDFVCYGNLDRGTTAILICSRLAMTIRDRGDWPTSGSVVSVRISVGHMATLQRVENLLKMDTLLSANEARNELNRLLGTWKDPGSLLGMYKANPKQDGYPVPAYFRKPGVYLAFPTIKNGLVIQFLGLKCEALMILIDIQADEEDIKDLYSTVREWHELGIFMEANLARQLSLVSYGFAAGGNLEQAEGYCVEALKSDNINPDIYRTTARILRARGKYPEAKDCTISLLNALVKACQERKVDLQESDSKEIRRNVYDALLAHIENKDYAEALEYIRRDEGGKGLLRDTCAAICQYHLSGRIDRELLHPLRHFHETIEKTPLELREVRYVAEAAWIIGHHELAKTIAARALICPQLKLPWYSIYRPDLESLAAGNPCFAGAPPTEPPGESS